MEENNKTETKSINDRLAVRGRELKELKEQVEASEKRAADAELERDRALEIIRDSKALTEEYQGRSEARQSRADIEREKDTLAKAKLSHQLDISTGRAELVKGIALKYGVDPEFMVSLNLKSAEQIEKVAQRIGNIREEVTPEPELHPDSGFSSGGEHTPTTDELETMPMREYARWREKQKPKE